MRYRSKSPRPTAVTTRTYLLSVNRGTDAPFGWRAQDDFDTLLAAGTQGPRGPLVGRRDHVGSG